MHSYVDIKAAATKVLNDPAAHDGAKAVAAIAIMLADRTAKLEERHTKEIEELRTALKAQRR